MLHKLVGSNENLGSYQASVLVRGIACTFLRELCSHTVDRSPLNEKRPKLQ